MKDIIRAIGHLNMVLDEHASTMYADDVEALVEARRVLERMVK